MHAFLETCFCWRWQLFISLDYSAPGFFFPIRVPHHSSPNSFPIVSIAQTLSIVWSVHLIILLTCIMFKSSPFAFLWSKSTPPNTKSENVRITSSPQAFTFSKKGAGLMKVSMVETETDGADGGFVDIQCRKLSYAEVASLTPPRKATPAKGKIEANSFEVLRSEDVAENLTSVSYATITEEELPERVKTDNHSKKRKQKAKKTRH